MYDFRIVVQPGRTLRSGRRGRWFESSQSDHKKSLLCGGFFYGQTGADWKRRGGDVRAGGVETGGDKKNGTSFELPFFWLTKRIHCKDNALRVVFPLWGFCPFLLLCRGLPLLSARKCVYFPDHVTSRRLLWPDICSKMTVLFLSYPCRYQSGVCIPAHIFRLLVSAA